MKKVTYCISVLMLTTISLFFIFSTQSCRKTQDSKMLTFSSDQVVFDTIFTTIGSTYRTLSVRNPNNHTIKTDIILAGGNSSFYSLNVDGEPGTYFKNVEIPAKDSILIFIKVTINPQNQNNPFLVTDSIIFRIGDNKQDVDLVAFGQDANFIVGDTEFGTGSGIFYKIVAGENETVHWTSDRPYVIFGWAVVDEGGKLIVDEGTRVYLHNNGRLWVYQYGNIEVNGTAQNPVYFRSDTELSSYHNDVDDAKWDRIWICEGTQDNVINHAIISKAFVGIQVEPLSTDAAPIIASNTTYIKNTIIKFTQNAGIIGKRANLVIEDCVIADNGSGGIELSIGNFDLKHNTLYNQFSGSPNRTTPALYVSNYTIDGYDKIIGNTNFTAVNSIFYGSLKTEVSFDKENQAELNYQVENCLYKAENDQTNFVNCIRNHDPLFKNTETKQLDLRINANSPAINAGKSEVGVFSDILGNPFAAPPTIGAYEYGE
ncbi:MAG: hypothetical protein LBU51_00945 [Bacteroidales bacterium]|nr:hypothetical protein [Bacteroidales bacterium]